MGGFVEFLNGGMTDGFCHVRIRLFDIDSEFLGEYSQVIGKYDPKREGHSTHVRQIFVRSECEPLFTMDVPFPGLVADYFRVMSVGIYNPRSNSCIHAVCKGLLLGKADLPTDPREQTILVRSWFPLIPTSHPLTVGS